MLTWGLQDFAHGLASDLGESSTEKMMAGSWMGLGFPSPETIPCLVLFLDQTQLPIEGVVGI